MGLKHLWGLSNFEIYLSVWEGLEHLGEEDGAPGRRGWSPWENGVPGVGEFLGREFRARRSAALEHRKRWGYKMGDTAFERRRLQY